MPRKTRGADAKAKSLTAGRRERRKQAIDRGVPTVVLANAARGRFTIFEETLRRSEWKAIGALTLVVAAIVPSRRRQVVVLRRLANNLETADERLVGRRPTMTK